MPVKIGSKYEETKARLREKILSSEIEIVKGDSIPEIQSLGAQCYFCRKPIERDILVLRESDFFYPIDVECFLQATLNFYVNGIAYSVN